MYTREYFNDGKGVSIWIVWDDAGNYRVGETEAIARQRFLEREVDWREVALSIILQRPITHTNTREFEEIILKEQK